MVAKFYGWKLGKCFSNVITPSRTNRRQIFSLCVYWKSYIYRNTFWILFIVYQRHISRYQAGARYMQTDTVDPLQYINFSSHSCKPTEVCRTPAFLLNTSTTNCSKLLLWTSIESTWGCLSSCTKTLEQTPSGRNTKTWFLIMVRSWNAKRFDGEESNSCVPLTWRAFVPTSRQIHLTFHLNLELGDFAF